MTDIIIGCPVSHREWVMDAWYGHVEAACETAGVRPEFLHVGDPHTDPGTWEIIERRAGHNLFSVQTIESDRVDRRRWPEERFRLMVELRNKMLMMVRSKTPDYFLSLDSDILLHKNTIASLLDASGPEWGAVGGKCYMDLGTECPSYAAIGRTGNLMRRDVEMGLFKVDVIMGIKLMAPAAYNIDYKFDMLGEDVGWSKNCREAGVRLRWDARTVSKHCYRRDLLERVDNRIGW